MQPERLCLFLDVDGSLIDIAPRPDAVVVPRTLPDDLRAAARALEGALALVSGRSIAQLDGLFGRPLLPAAGVHGAELRLEAEGPVTQAPDAVIPPAVRDDLQATLASLPGTLVEDKGFSIAVHFRAVPETGEAVHAALRALVDRHAEAPLTLLPGHFVVDIKRPGFDKGTAVRRFLAQPPFADRRPVFIGDDVTDRPGFAAALAAGGEAYGVGQEIPGTTGTFADPSAVRRWIGTIASRESIPA